jgi:hypothetical protein
MVRIARSARRRHNRRELNRVINTASPAMQQELVAAWARHTR